MQVLPEGVTDVPGQAPGLTGLPSIYVAWKQDRTAAVLKQCTAAWGMQRCVCRAVDA